MAIISSKFRLFLMLPAALAGSFEMAHAEMSDWVDNAGGRMRLIALPPDSDGTMQGSAADRAETRLDHLLARARQQRHTTSDYGCAGERRHA